MATPPRRIALTGGIGTGKSFVLRHLARCGVPTLDTDVAARDAVRPGESALAAVVARFGPGVLRADGTLDRAGLGHLVFADAAARRDLEAILHPVIWRAVFEWLTGLQATGVVAVPLLFETGQQQQFDRVLLTDCPEDLEVERVMARDGLDEVAVRARVAAQMPAAERRKLADAVVDTSGSEEDTVRRLEMIWSGWGLPALEPREP